MRLGCSGIATRRPKWSVSTLAAESGAATQSSRMKKRFKDASFENTTLSLSFAFGHRSIDQAHAEQVQAAFIDQKRTRNGHHIRGMDAFALVGVLQKRVE